MDNYYDSLRTWIEVDTDAILNNHNLVANSVPEGTKIAAVLKADAYGHGACEVAKLLQKHVDFFAVAMTDEAEEIRREGIDVPILILGRTPKGAIPSLLHYNIQTTVSSVEEAKEIADYAVSEKGKIAVHIAIDTGMSRIGFPCSPDSVPEIRKITELEGIEIKGIFSHFASSDSADLTYARMQEKKFDEMLGMLSENGISFETAHICNSAALTTQSKKYDMVREGIILYGLAPSEETDMCRFEGIKPAMSFKTRVSHIKTVPAGTSVSYGCTFSTKSETRIATLQAGYADGVPRSLSNRGSMLIRGHKVPIIGRVCMDQLMVDITGFEDIREGDIATIFGKDGENSISVEEIASIDNTINYEIICGISRRVPKVYTKSGKFLKITRTL